MHAAIHPLRGASFRLAVAVAALAAPLSAHASFLHGDTLDAFANFLSWFVIVLMPIAAIAIFLYIHVLPEKIAEKRQHPHKDSIKVLCILSLFFGGLLWPFAWLWAYTRPIGYRAVYGTEKHEDYYVEMGEMARHGELTAVEIAHLRAELEVMASKGALAPALVRLLEDIGSAVPKSALPPPSPDTPTPAATPRATRPVGVAGSD
jgi:hypothetical protein